MGPIFIILIVVAVLVAAASGNMQAVSTASLTTAKSAVLDVALPLVGVMALFLGLVRILEKAGLMATLAWLLRPVFKRLFPEIPDRHPALGMMTLNISANMLGLANAATPFGIEAMRQLDRLNGKKGTATDAMCLFLAINTSNVALLPTGVIGIRVSLGSADPMGIWVTTWLATMFSTMVGIAVALLLARLGVFRASRPPLALDEGPAEKNDASVQEAAPPWRPGRLAVASALFIAATLISARVLVTSTPDRAGLDLVMHVLSSVLLPLLILFMVLYGWARGVAVYASVVEGAKQGFQVALLIIPYLVAILVAVGMFRASGALDAIIGAINPLTSAVGFPPEALPMALLRPLSGSGALGVMTEAMQTYGPDSFVGYLVSTLQGSTETTFYVLAVYGGAIGLKRTRHALPACLIADIAGVVGATAACHLLVSAL